MSLFVQLLERSRFSFQIFSHWVGHSCVLQPLLHRKDALCRRSLGHGLVLGVSLALGCMVTIATNILSSVQVPARSEERLGSVAVESRAAGRESLSGTLKAQPVGRVAGHRIMNPRIQRRVNVLVFWKRTRLSSREFYSPAAGSVAHSARAIPSDRPTSRRIGLLSRNYCDRFVLDRISVVDEALAQERQWPHPPLVLRASRDERVTRHAWNQSAVVLGYDVHGNPWLWPTAFG